MPQISIIIPIWNRVTLISRAIDSVLAQTHLPDEIIVVDDGSTDNTSDMINRQYPQVRLLFQENKGVSSARNLGIKAAQGEWIAFLDSDDEWKPEKIDKQMKTILDNPDHLICHTNETWVRHGVRVNPMQKHQKHGGYIFQRCLPLCIISPSSVMIHRSVFDDVGVFDESLPACEDYDLWLRICAKYPVLYLNEELITKHGGHTDQLSHAHWGMDRFRITALEKIITNPSLNQDDRDAAIATMLKKIRIYLAGATRHGNTEHVTQFKSLLEQYEHTKFDHGHKVTT